MIVEEVGYLAIVVWLVASTQTLVNLIAIEATKPHRWRFFRLTIFPLVISLLALKSAYELIFILAIQYMIVCLAATYLGPYKTTRESTEKDAATETHSAFKFNLTLLFGITTVVAAITVLVLAMKKDMNRDGWISMLVVPLAGGLMAVLYMFGSRWTRIREGRTWFLRSAVWVGATFASIFVYAIPAWFDFLINALVPDSFVGWPPADSTIFTVDRPIVLWFLVGTIGSLLTCFAGWFLFLKPAAGRVAIVVVWFVVSALPIWVMICLLIPQWSFAQPSSEENAYPEIVAIGKEISESEFRKALDQYSDWKTIPSSDQRKCVEELRPILQRLNELDSKPCFIPLKFSMDDIGDFSGIRDIARAFHAVGEFEMDRDPQLACDYFLKGCRFSIGCRKNGLMIHDLVGSACLDNSSAGLISNRRYFKVEKAHDTAVKLLEMVEQLETSQTVLDREERWSRNIHWTSSTQWILSDLLGRHASPIESTSSIFRKLRTKEVARVRLCCIGLILESCFARQGSFPQSLDEIEDLLPASAWIDPFAANPQKFKYQKTAASYILYSVGDNGIDDGGDTSVGSGIEPNDLVLE